MTDIEDLNPIQDEGPSDAEQRFLDLQRRPGDYGVWARKVRKRWAESPAGLLAARRLREGAR